jgi:hypothetical protein
VKLGPHDLYYLLVTTTSAALLGTMLFLLYVWFDAARNGQYALVIYVNAIGEFWYEIGFMAVLLVLGVIAVLATFARIGRN